MFRHRFSILAAPLLAAILLILLAEPAAAQRRGRVAYSRSYPVYRGSAYRPVYYGYYRPYIYYPYSYAYYYGGYSYPVYYGAPYAVEVPVYSPPAGYQSFYPPGTVPPDAAAAPAPALSEQVVQVQVRVPGNAQVWFGGASTQQNGSVREFVSPPLVPGRDYTYQIRARWMEGGREIDQTRTVRVHAGERVTVDFTRPA